MLTPDCLNAASVLLRTPGHTGPENPFTPPVSAVPTGVVQCTAPVATGDDPAYPREHLFRSMNSVFDTVDVPQLGGVLNVRGPCESSRTRMSERGLAARVSSKTHPEKSDRGLWGRGGAR